MLSNAATVTAARSDQAPPAIQPGDSSANPAASAGTANVQPAKTTPCRIGSRMVSGGSGAALKAPRAYAQYQYSTHA
jgi:hypothetical protein